jgi:hypothetical protein
VFLLIIVIKRTLDSTQRREALSSTDILVLLPQFVDKAK